MGPRRFLQWVSGLLLTLSVSAFHCPNTTTAAQIVAGRDLTGQTHVVTGGDSGIGYATAMALASKNATVVLGCRGTEGKYAQAVENITRATGNSKVFIILLDLSSFASVRAFAAELVRRTPRVDALLCNAGIEGNPSSLPPLTVDGFERVFQVNYLSHVLLVQELLPSLRRSRGRVIHVSSSGSFIACMWSAQDPGCMDIDRLPPPVPPQVPAFLGNATNYGVSKYLQVFHAAELARREDVITAFSLMPGVVETGMTADVLHALCKGRPHCPLTAAEGAATSVYIATAPSDDLLADDGKYFLECESSKSVLSDMVDSVGEAATLNYQKQLWDKSLGWLHGNAALLV